MGGAVVILRLGHKVVSRHAVSERDLISFTMHVNGFADVCLEPLHFVNLTGTITCLGSYPEGCICV